MSDREQAWTRRAFLRSTAAASVAGAAGCGPESEKETEDAGPDVRQRIDAGPREDATPDVPDPSDAASEVADDIGADTDTASNDATQDGPRGSAEELADEARPVRMKGPWLTIVNGSLRWTVETQGEETLTLVVEDQGERWQAVTTPSTREVAFRWPPTTGLNVEDRDEPGEYTVHSVTLDALPPGVRVAWTLRGLQGGDVTGTVRVPVVGRVAFHTVWVSDTMFPTSVPVAEALATSEPDLLIHGGDIQYQSNPLDTWNGYFRHFGDAMKLAPIHYCIGNHEYEAFDEFDDVYARLIGNQGDGPDIGYHAFTWGAWRFVLLNSEVDFTRSSLQGQWAEAELSAARSHGGLDGAIVCFHRPYYTFSRSRPRLSAREDMHPLFVEYEVPLILTGHNHCYERFEVDGITYVMDGGGGASLYNPDDSIWLVEDERPEELALRVAVERSHGWLSLQFDPDSTIRGVRTNDLGEISDEFTIEAQ